MLQREFEKLLERETLRREDGSYRVRQKIEVGEENSKLQIEERASEREVNSYIHFLILNLPVGNQS